METITRTPEQIREYSLKDFDAFLADAAKLLKGAEDLSYDLKRTCEKIGDAFSHVQDARSGLKFEADIVIELIGSIRGLIPFARGGTMSGPAMSDPLVKPDLAIKRAEEAIAAATDTF